MALRDDFAPLDQVDLEHELTGGSATTRNKPYSDRTRKFLLITLLIVSVIALAFMIATIVLASKKSKSNSSDVAVCTTPDCVKLSATVMNSMDTSFNPCDDFYSYACAGWNANNPIPDDQSRWGTFNLLAQNNQRALQKLLESEPSASSANDAHDAISKARRFYSSCLNLSAIDQEGYTPINTLLQTIDWNPAANSPWDEIARFRLASSLVALNQLDIDPFISLSVYPDDKNSSKNLLHVDQNGISLPDPDYYSRDPNTDANLMALRTYMSTLFRLTGHSDPNAAAGRVLSLEIALAGITVPSDDLRDPESTYNPRTITQIHATDARNFTDWAAWISNALVPRAVPELLMVSVPTYIESLGRVLSNSSLISDPQTTVVEYLKWKAISSFAAHLSQPFRDAEFAYSQVIRGVINPTPRWKRCISLVDGALGYATGAMFVRDKFAGNSRQIAQGLIKEIRESFAQSLPSLSWMDDQTRAAALDKVSAIVEKIGYPDWILDSQRLNSYYQKLSLDPLAASQSFSRALLQVRRFEVDNNRDDLNQPVDKSRWDMTPPTVNAYYSPTNNEIAFPAGILQSPFFDDGYPMAYNLGGIGVVMGHELTHSLDDQGSQYDKDGNLKPWWQPSVVAAFKNQTQCIVDQYEEYTVNDDHVNGRLTLGENIADNGGLKQSYAAYLRYEQQNGPEPRLPGLESIDARQLFFLGFAQIWCGASRPAEAHRLILTDPHSPAKYRVIGTLSNSADFAQAFSCPAGSKMNPAKKCSVW